MDFMRFARFSGLWCGVGSDHDLVEIDIYISVEIGDLRPAQQRVQRQLFELPPQIRMATHQAVHEELTRR